MKTTGLKAKPSEPHTHFLTSALACWMEISGLIGLSPSSPSTRTRTHKRASHRFRVWDCHKGFNLLPLYRVPVSWPSSPAVHPTPTPPVPLAFPAHARDCGPASRGGRSAPNPRTHPRLSASPVWSKMVSETVSSLRPA